MRRAFTLVEVLVVIVIIGILASLFLGALSYSAETAREARTKAMIARLDAVISARWESYRTRRLPFVYDAATASWAGALRPDLNTTQRQQWARLTMLREIQRLELPMRWDDVTTLAGVPNLARPGVSQAYLRRYTTAATAQHEGAECLFLIVTMGAVDEEANPIDQFTSMSTGDVDGDGFPEFLDGWGNPIEFFRWAPALSRTFYFLDSTNYSTPTIVSETIRSNIQPDPGVPGAMAFSLAHHDPFDPSMVDLPHQTTTITSPPIQWVASSTDTLLPRGFRLYPLIVSAGPDGGLGMRRQPYSAAGAIDPYYWPETDADIGPDGAPRSPNAPDTEHLYATAGDNITNHTLQVR